MNKAWPLLILLIMVVGCGPEPAEQTVIDAGPTEPEIADVPDNSYCRPVGVWDESYIAKEEELLVLVNEVRAKGAHCGPHGAKAPTHPLEMEGALRCAARVHSLDMNERNFFAHNNPSGQTPWYRIAQAGYTATPVGENIAMGRGTAEGVMQQWMNSPGHCANIMEPSYDYMGAGYTDGTVYGHTWTQTFGGSY